jgi:eukaryotic-like serine/threonine-protein kinase
MSDVPLRSDLDRMVDRYLGELALALQRLPVSERDHLLGEIREHISELRAERAPRDAWDMEALLNRVGLPEDIAAAALENVDDDVAGASLGPTPPPTPAPSPMPAPPTAPVPTPGRSWSRRNRLLAGLAAAAVIVLVVAVGVAAGRHGAFVRSSSVPSVVIPAVRPDLPSAPSRLTVPDVIGLSVPDATAELQAAGLVVGGVAGSPTGDVVSQSPVAGSIMPAGSTVTIEVSQSPSL